MEKDLGISPPEMRPIQAVSAIIFSTEGDIYTVVETTSMPDYGKYAGMRTIPMETMKEGERHEDTLMRLIKEEVGDNVVKVLAYERIGIYGLNNAAATCYAVCAEFNGEIEPEIDGVVDPKWIKPGDLLNRWTRGGVKEMIEDYLNGERNVSRSTCMPVEPQPKQ